VSSEPAVHIAIRVNDRAPAIFSTALGKQEHNRLSEWITSHPDLADLVERARALAEAVERGDEEEVG
jgi:hypothetical protein